MTNSNNELSRVEMGSLTGFVDDANLDTGSVQLIGFPFLDSRLMYIIFSFPIQSFTQQVHAGLCGFRYECRANRQEFVGFIAA
jgi:hypothetical protein